MAAAEENFLLLLLLNPILRPDPLLLLSRLWFNTHGRRKRKKRLSMRLLWKQGKYPLYHYGDGSAECIRLSCGTNSNLVYAVRNKISQISRHGGFRGGVPEDLGPAAHPWSRAPQELTRVRILIKNRHIFFLKNVFLTLILFPSWSMTHPTFLCLTPPPQELEQGPQSWTSHLKKVKKKMSFSKKKRILR